MVLITALEFFNEKDEIKQAIINFKPPGSYVCEAFKHFLAQKLKLFVKDLQSNTTSGGVL